MEENILKKANQKKLLGDIAIEGGAFTTDFFKKVCSIIIFQEFYSLSLSKGIFEGVIQGTERRRGRSCCHGNTG